ncbi:MAG: hypothetical protein BWX54_02385 [Verrucomicrobia bacterium ADurb.Bin018]|nr:MAG: hypothetical protein BWX54_02385 [Verrucomicrobia bacterium ADurb.Bin018]
MDVPPRTSGTMNRMDKIHVMLSRAGVKAETEYLRYEFSTAMANAAMQMKNTYGSMICASGRTFAALLPTVTQCRANPIPAMPTTMMPNSTAPTKLLTRRAKRHAGASPSVRRDSMNTGMNADESAPSPNNARNKLGSRNATTNADITGSVPNIRAVSTSRTMPSTRLSMVKPPTANANRMTLRFSMRLRSPRPGTSWPPGTALESDSGRIPACARSSSAARGTPLHATSWSTPQMARFFATHIQF